MKNWQNKLVLSLGLFSVLGTVPVRAQDFLKPADNLVVEGIPPVPKSLVEQVAYYTEGRSAAFLSWHPTRREMLVSTRFGDTAQVHRVSMPGGARSQMTFYPQRVSGAHWRPKTADGMVFSKDIGGSEFFQLYWKEAQTGKVSMFTDGKSRNTGGVFAPSGRVLFYESTKRNGKDTDIYRVDPADPRTEKLILQVEGGGWSAVAVSPDEKTLLVQNEVSANESHYFLVDVATAKKTEFSPALKEKVSYGRAVFTPDGKKVIWTTDKGSEFMRLVAVEVSTGKWEELTPGLSWEVSGFDLSEDGRYIAYIINEAGISRLNVLDLTTRKPVQLPSLPTGVMADPTFHPKTQELAFTLSSARSPADAYSINLKTKKLERWTESETGGLDAKTFSEPQLVRWDSFDKLKISGFLFRPPAQFTGKRPVLIIIHGGPEGQSFPSYQGRNNYYLNEMGVALIYPNVRGSTGFGKTYLASDNWEKREDSVKDIGALLDWIAQDPSLDASRVAVMGGSYGGYMSLACMTHFNDRVRGGIDIVGISNFVTFLEHTEGYRRDLRRVEYGDERIPQMREFLQKISPLTNAKKITKPMFVVQGKNDPRVPVTEAEQMVAAIKTNGAPVWYLMAKDEGHGFARKANADFQFFSTIRFLQDYLIK